VSVTEPSNEVNAEMAEHFEGGRLALSSKSPPSVSCLVGWCLVFGVVQHKFVTVGQTVNSSTFYLISE
jgi:hypothetical protein